MEGGVAYYAECTGVAGRGDDDGGTGRHAHFENGAERVLATDGDDD